jgi:hypothetical protein
MTVSRDAWINGMLLGCVMWIVLIAGIWAWARYA